MRRRRRPQGIRAPLSAAPSSALAFPLLVGGALAALCCSSGWSASGPTTSSSRPSWAWVLAGGPRQQISAQPSLGERCGVQGVACRAEKDHLANAVAGFRKDGAPNTPLPRPDLEDWTDYTRYALGLDSREVTDEGIKEAQELQRGEMRKYAAFTDRRRALGIDFGPQFVGLSMSMGGTNTIAMGTLKTGADWKDTAIKIVQMVSTRRVKDVVIGHPLEKDGSEGKIGTLVRHFAQVLSDATLLMLGGNITVYLWDERFSTTYAAMRLTTRARFDSAAFKSWLDGQRGLNFGAKALLDAEASRAILEHFLQKDPVSEELNKEKAERVPPSRDACRAYLKWRRRPLLEMGRPTEPAGPGLEAFEWDDQHPEAQYEDDELFEERLDSYERMMAGMDSFGDLAEEGKKVKADRQLEIQKNRLARAMQEEKPNPIRDALKSITDNKEGEGYDRYRRSQPMQPETWD